MSFPRKYKGYLLITVLINNEGPLEIEQIIKPTSASWAPRGVRLGAITIHEPTMYQTKYRLDMLLPDAIDDSKCDINK
jgi:hypothetical protein